MEELVLQDDKIEAKVSKDIIDNLSTDIASKYDEKLSSVEEKSFSNYIWLTFGFCLISLFTAFSPVGDFLKERVVNYAEFNARDFTGNGVAMSPKLKILVKDDNLIAFMGKANLSITEWSDLLEFISKHEPEAIYIDKIFSITGFSEGDTEGQKEFDKAIKQIESLTVPIYVGTSLNDRPIPLRSSLEFKDYLNDLSHYVEPNAATNQKNFGLLIEKYTNPIDKKLAYSRHPKYKNAFNSASIHYFSERYFSPLHSKIVESETKLLPHMGLLTGQELKLSEKGLFVNGVLLPQKHGRAVVNYLKPSQVLSQARTIKNIMRRIIASKQDGKFYNYSKFLKPGDHVFIIPEFFTGSTDFKSTPYGNSFGGIVPTSIMNSSLQKKWITEYESPFLVIVYLILTGLITSYLLPLFGWVFLVVGNFCVITLGLYLFSYKDLAIPWFFTSIFSFLLGAAIMVLKAKTEKNRQKIIEEMKLETEMISKENLLFEENQKVLLQEKREAAMIASAFSPDPIPEWEGIKITGHHKCFDAASGDWFFFEKSLDGKYMFGIMCDITGHGVQAALIVSTCKTVLNTIKKNNPALLNSSDFPLEYLRMLNSILYIQGKTHHVTTFAGFTFIPSENKAKYVTCAHPPPVVHKAGGNLEKPTLLRMRNDPVGYEPNINTEMEEFDFEKGDKIVVHTDGIPITENFRFYRNYLKAHPEDWSNDPLDLYHYIWKRIGDKTGKDPDDDVSIMIYKRL